MPRAYQPRQSTLDLARRIRALDGVARVDILPPTIWDGVKRPARVKVTLTETGTHTTFTMAEAREWLQTEETD